MLVRETIILFKKELKLEWRQKFAFNSILLYLGSTIFIAYLSFNVKAGSIMPEVWNALFWIIILFTAVNAIAKSFMLEKSGRLIYYYVISSPQSVIISKIIYNSLLMITLGLLGFWIYNIVFNNPVKDQLLFYLDILMASLGFSVTLTMISSIAAKAANSHTLMTILSLPIIVPVLLMIIKIANNAIEGMARSASQDELVTLAALIIMIGALAYILFPYLWRS
ncbi:MAG: heme exporter protein CcmB [Candidatus Cyclobacteriaceae bacterium M3_2C_046]